MSKSTPSTLFDLAELGRQNDAFRLVVHTDCYTQITLMSVLNQIPNETHDYATQIVTVQDGKALALIGNKKFRVGRGQTFVIPRATPHTIINDNARYNQRLKLLVHYSPPLHPINEVSFKQPDEDDTSSE